MAKLSGLMEKVINKQINAEFYSAYLYLSMAAWYESRNLKGFANWMRVQAQEETVHALMFYDFVLQRGAGVTLAAIDSPPVSWKTPLEPFEEALRHEQKVTGLINELVNSAMAEKDHATTAFLQWFVNEQVEEEANADEICQKLRLVGDGGGLFMLDRELAARVFVPPAATAGGKP